MTWPAREKWSTSQWFFSKFLPKKQWWIYSNCIALWTWLPKTQKNHNKGKDIRQKWSWTANDWKFHIFWKVRSCRIYTSQIKGRNLAVHPVYVNVLIVCGGDSLCNTLLPPVTEPKSSETCKDIFVRFSIFIFAVGIFLIFFFQFIA